MANLCHLGDLIHAFYSGVKVRLLVLTHYGDARGGSGTEPQRGYCVGFGRPLAPTAGSLRDPVEGACLETALGDVL